MPTMEWDPSQYLAYADERLRPFVELVEHIGATDPSFVVDLGCGPGNATVRLVERWPEAKVLGVDFAPEMIERARALEVPPTVSFEIGDARSFQPREVDVLVSNATLQWVPGHLEYFPRFVAALNVGGWFAFQVPNMQDQPSHAMLAELVRSARWDAKLGAALRQDRIEPPEHYLETLSALGCRADAWETTYYQVLPGEDAVLEWVKGSALRPFLSLLDRDETEELLGTYGASLRAKFPKGPNGTVFPFRRVFVVAQRVR